MINSIEPSPFDPGTCYVAGTRYKLGDYSPYLYKTTDYGVTWKPLPMELLKKTLQELSVQISVKKDYSMLEPKTECIFLMMMVLPGNLFKRIYP